MTTPACLTAARTEIYQRRGVTWAPSRSRWTRDSSENRSATIYLSDTERESLFAVGSLPERIFLDCGRG